MSDFIIKTGDTAIFNPTFGVATVVVVPGTITGSSKIQIDGAIACVQGDEASVVVPGVAYVTPAAPAPGVGTLTISALGSDQLAQKTNSSQKPLILKGSSFTAQFQVMTPATNPTSGTPDATPKYSGTGQFMTSNVKSKGT